MGFGMGMGGGECSEGDCPCSDALCTPIYEDATPTPPLESGDSPPPSSSSDQVQVSVTITLADTESFTIKLGILDADDYWYATVTAGTPGTLKIALVTGGVESLDQECEIERPAGTFDFCAARRGTLVGARVSGDEAVDYGITSSVETLPGTEWGIEGDGTAVDLLVTDSNDPDCPDCGALLTGCAKWGILPPNSSDNLVVDLTTLIATDNDEGPYDGTDCEAHETSSCNFARTGDCTAMAIEAIMEERPTGIYFGYNNDVVVCREGYYCKDAISLGAFFGDRSYAAKRCCWNDQGGTFNPSRFHESGYIYYWFLLEDAGTVSEHVSIYVTVELVSYWQYYVAGTALGTFTLRYSSATYAVGLTGCQRLRLSLGEIVNLPKLSESFGGEGDNGVCDYEFPAELPIRFEATASNSDCAAGNEPPLADYQCILVQRCDCPGYDQRYVRVLYNTTLKVGDFVRLSLLSGIYEVLAFGTQLDCADVAVPTSHIREFLDDCVTADLPPSCDCCASDTSPTYITSASFSIGVTTSTPSTLADEFNAYIAGNWELLATETPGVCAEGVQQVIPITEYPGENFYIDWNVIGPFSGFCFWRVQISRDSGAIAPGGYVLGYLSEIPPCDTGGTPTTTDCDRVGIQCCFSTGNSSNYALFDTVPADIRLVPNSSCPSDDLPEPIA